MTFSYRYASPEQLVEHLASASRATVCAALRRYREQGRADLVVRIKNAYVQARIARLAMTLTN